MTGSVPARPGRVHDKVAARGVELVFVLDLNMVLKKSNSDGKKSFRDCVVCPPNRFLLEDAKTWVSLKEVSPSAHRMKNYGR